MSIRLEKILYEKLFNTQMLGRARTIGAPRHWYYDPYDRITQLTNEKPPIMEKETGLRRLYEKIHAKFGY